MSAFIDLTAQRFGRLIVIKRMNNNKWRNSRWLCKCDCGEKKIILGYSLRSGDTQSCGCLNREIVSIYNIKHGHSTRTKMSKIYKAWCGIIQRCTNPKDKGYHNYGGRGIKICKRWMKFENFLEDMGEPPTQEHSIDRINNNRNYCKSNCRWSTPKEQSRNTRRNHLITFNGKTQCLIEWAEQINISIKTLWARINRGWPIEKALTTPVKNVNRNHYGDKIT